MAQPKLAGTAHWDKHARGTPDDMSAEQREVLADFLKRVPPDQLESMRFPCETPEHFGCRVLRARKFDASEALKCVEATCTWRRKARVRDLAGKDLWEVLGRTVSEDELKFFYPKTYFPTRDKEGRPVYIERGGAVDVEVMLMLTDLDRLVDAHVHANETVLRELYGAASEAAGKPVTSLMSVVDMGGMSMKMVGGVARNYVGRMISIDRDYYPETLGHMLIVNVPSFFALGWKLISGFLDERTTRKIEIYAGPEKWKPRLLELVGAENTPVEYGGSLVIPGGLFPASRTQQRHMSGGQVYAERVQVAAGQTVHFKWFCRPGDMRFGVWFVAGRAPPTAAAAGGASGRGSGDKHGHGHAHELTRADITAEVAAAAGGATVVHALRDHPGSDKAFVTCCSTAPADGYFLAAWDNSKGWLAREVYHRWDFMEADSSAEPGAAAQGGAGSSSGGTSGLRPVSTSSELYAAQRTLQGAGQHA